MADKDKAPQVIDGETRPPRVVINRDYEIPGIAGSSADGNTVYIDRRIPKTLRLSNGKDMKLDHPLAVHELTEKVLVDRFGLAYDHAHYIAYAAERRAVELAGDIWSEYDDFMMKLINECYDWEYTDLPPDYDVYPHIGIHGGNPADEDSPTP